MTRAETVDEVVRRLVEYYQPERICLFGSSARGDTRPESDLDFLVVLPDETPLERFFDGKIYERLWDSTCGGYRSVSPPDLPGAH